MSFNVVCPVTLEVIKQAVNAGELDTRIEQVSGALRAGFAKNKK